nr:replicative DNA helicase [Desulfobacterales bacterium]
MKNRGVSTQKIPPQNIEAEQSILSAILIENNALFEVLEIISEEDFYRDAHQKIFRGMIELFEKNEPIDLITLANLLKEKGQLETVGGAAYLAELVDKVPMATNANYYARIIQEKAVLRRLISSAVSIANRCYEDRGDVEELLDFAERSVFEISENRVKPAFYSIGELLTENFKTLDELYEKKSLITGVPTGFRDLDTLTSGLQPSDLIIIAGRPSMGKTAIALNIAQNASVKTGIPVVIFSLEMSKEQLSMRMLCSEARVDSFRLRGGFLKKSDWAKLNRAAGVLSEAPIYIDDSPALSVLEIRAKARRLKMEKGLGLIVLDYLQLMKGRSDAERRELEISEISRSLKALAKELNIPVLVLSQLNRKVEDRSDKRPRLADLRESGAIEQDADVIAFIYRDELYHKEEGNKGVAELIVAKQRNGPIGTVKLTFIDAYTRFEDWVEEPE